MTRSVTGRCARGSPATGSHPRRRRQALEAPHAPDAEDRPKGKEHENALPPQHRLERGNEPEARLGTLLQDTLRSSAFASLACFDQRKVIALLNALPGMDAGERTVVDATLMMMLSAAVLQERFGLLQ